jgi:RNA polymerase sigma factor (sigma-70 family)
MLAADEDAWQEFVDRYSPGIRLAIRAAGHRLPSADQEEIFSAVLKRLVDRHSALLRQFRWRCSLDSYLSLIARCEVNRYCRRRLVDRTHQVAAPLVPSEPPTQLIREALSRLSPRDRLLLQAVYLDGLSYAQSAALLRVSPNSIGPLVGRALLRLRGIIREFTFP